MANLPCGDGRRSAAPNVDVADAVAIGEAEGFFVLDIGGHALQAPAGHRVLAGVDQRDPPGLRVLLMHSMRLFAMSKVTSDMCRK